MMLFRLILSILSMALENILSECLRWALSLLWIRLKKKMILFILNLKTMKNNIWKIVIGAVSAALGYILNAIGL
jgi:TctA family transporter